MTQLARYSIPGCCLVESAASEMTCQQGNDLNRWDGETINMDYHDFFGLDVIEKCREKAERSNEVLRTWNVYSSDFEGYDKNNGWYRRESGINGAEDLSLNACLNTLDHVSDEHHKGIHRSVQQPIC